MIREHQDHFYEAVGRRLTNERQRRKLSITALAKRTGEQYNTIKGIEDGSRFYFHHAVWIFLSLGISIDQLVKDVQSVNFKRVAKELEVQANGKEESKAINDFI